MRVAFSEGFGNAFSAMILDDPVYKDAHFTQQSTLFWFDIDNNTCGPTSGWFSECSVQSILYDLYDNSSVGGGGDDDVLSMGLSPIYNVLIRSSAQQYGTYAMTSVFSFIHHLKTNTGNGNIDALVLAQSIDSVADVYGAGEANDAFGTASALPVYETIVDRNFGGAVVNVCSTGEYQGYNGVGVYRFLKFVASATGLVNITANRTSGINPSDPDIELFYKGSRIGTAWSTASNTEALNEVSLTAGEIYIIQINEDDYYNSGYTSGGTDVTCFDVAVN